MWSFENQEFAQDLSQKPVILLLQFVICQFSGQPVKAGTTIPNHPAFSGCGGSDSESSEKLFKVLYRSLEKATV